MSIPVEQRMGLHNKNNHKIFSILIILWIVQSIITAYYTELYSDEAYYWMYSQFLDWGYFDHPPGVGAMIWLGSFLGKTELAVRIVNIFICAGALVLMYIQVKPKNPLLFGLTIFSFLSLHILGFVSLPDTPFYFFAILFLVFYKNFLEKESLKNQLLLGLSAALMLYSKYHGVLVILFVIMSNPKLLTNYRFYTAGFIGVLLFLPHIWWQISHKFPSLQYHLIDRGSQYKIGHTLEYILGNIPFHGGVVALALFVATFYYRATSLWEKSLKWNLYGTLVFFFFITFKGQHIEPNWTIFCLFPLFYFGYKVIETSKWLKAYYVTVIIFSTLLLVAKIHLIHPFFIAEKDRVWDFHLSRNFAKQAELIAGDRIIAANSYQSASLLNFYTNKDYFISALNINSRANQYSFWTFDSLLCNTDIAYIYGGGHLGGEAIQGRRFYIENVALIDNVTSLNYIRIVEPEMQVTDSSVHISLHAIKNYSKDCTLEDDLHLEANMYQGDTLIAQHHIPFEIESPESLPQKLEFNIAVEQPERVEKILLKLYSPKLGGSNNKYVVID
ncbi:MAG: glycosyltransferase family 39 protein [Bacteroidota bacterium]|nr:glycosyltransferase family 39 protein [Bacteroidota bacterium]